MGGFSFCLNTDRCVNYHCDRRLDLPKRRYLEQNNIHVNKIFFNCIQERRFKLGTNYYLHIDICEKCGRPLEIKHLGKSSNGWKFLFHKQKGMEDYESFMNIVEICVNNGAKIVDEYDNEISYIDFVKLIRSKQHEYSQSYTENIDGYDFLSEDFD